MDLNSLLKDMGLVDAFSATLNQVEIEQAPSDCSSFPVAACVPGRISSNPARCVSR